MKILTQSLGESNQLSLWYHEDTIAERTINGQRIVLEVVGEVRLMTEEDGNWYKGADAISELAYDGRDNDSTLSELYENDLVDNMNWFQITNDTTGEEIITEIDTYDEGIKYLKELTDKEI